MSRSLPSLNALRVFEVAGKLQSFSRAALELNVTQGAVSRQIRALEDELDVKLFIRSTRRVELTTAGRAYLEKIQTAFQIIEQATDQLRADDVHALVTVSVLPSIGSFWLMPRLNRFSQRYPGLETRIVSSIEPIDFNASDADVAIRVGALPGKRYAKTAPRVDLIMTTDWRDVEIEALAPDVMVPVASPALLAGQLPATPADLLQWPLIHTSSRPDAWPDWCRHHGLEPPKAVKRAEYGHFFMSLEAARQGQGVALVPDILLDGLDPAVLTRLDALHARSAAEYYLLYPKSRLEEAPIQKFRRWIHDELSRHATPDGP